MKRIPHFLTLAIALVIMASSPSFAAEKSRAALQTDLDTYKLNTYNAGVNYDRLIDITDSAFNKTTDDINDLVGSTTITDLGTVTTGTFTSLTINGKIVGPSEIVAATNILTSAECGKKMTLAHATEFVTTLPAPSLGCEFTFIVGAAPSGASYTIKTSDNLETISGIAYDMTGGAVSAGAGTAAADTITLVNGTALVADRVNLWSDGSRWHGIAFSSASGAITFTSAQ